MASLLVSRELAGRADAHLGRRTFNAPFKFHLADHIGDRVLHETPTSTTECEFENMAGRIARVSSSRTHRLPAARIAGNVIAKLRVVRRRAARRWRRRS
eukprot:7765808-Pyramimonas_sp.AAC.1